MLAKEDEPLVLADGTKIDPSTGSPVKKKKYVRVPRASEAQQEVVRVRRRLSDIPVPPSDLNTSSIIFFYTMLGLSNLDIAHACSITIDQVANIKKTNSYKIIEAEAAEAIRAKQASSVREVIEYHAEEAATRMVQFMDAEDEKVAVTATKDILDRAGHRPVDIVEHKHVVSGGLRIEYVNKTEEEEIPTIDITPTLLESDEDVSDLDG